MVKSSEKVSRKGEKEIKKSQRQREDNDREKHKDREEWVIRGAQLKINGWQGERGKSGGKVYSSSKWSKEKRYTNVSTILI